MFSVLGASQVCVPGLSLSECVWDTQNQCAHVDSVDDRGTNIEFSSGDHKTRSHSNQLTLKSTIAIFNYMVTFEWKLWLNSTETFFSAVVLKVWRHAFLINCWWSRFSLHCLLSCEALSRKSIGKNVDLKKKKKTVNSIRPWKQRALVKKNVLDKRGDVGKLCFSTLQCAGKSFRHRFAARLSVYLRRIQTPLYFVDNKIEAFILVPFVNQKP